MGPERFTQNAQPVVDLWLTDCSVFRCVLTSLQDVLMIEAMSRDMGSRAVNREYDNLMVVLRWSDVSDAMIFRSDVSVRCLIQMFSSISDDRETRDSSKRECAEVVYMGLMICGWIWRRSWDETLWCSSEVETRCVLFVWGRFVWGRDEMRAVRWDVADVDATNLLCALCKSHHNQKSLLLS